MIMNSVKSRSKQQVYAEMLNHGLLRIRNGTTDPAMHALTCHTVADLLHNVPMNMLHEGFDDLDFYFLNIEVRSYIRYCEHLHVPPEAILLSLADELRGLIPQELKPKLSRL